MAGHPQVRGRAMRRAAHRGPQRVRLQDHADPRGRRLPGEDRRQRVPVRIRVQVVPHPYRGEDPDHRRHGAGGQPGVDGRVLGRAHGGHRPLHRIRELLLPRLPPGGLARREPLTRLARLETGNASEMRRGHSYIVVGAGALGSAAAYWLTRSGATDVLVLEQYGLGHGLGASEDHSRIIRHAYHSSVYTALTQAAYDAWAEIEGETGLQLVVKTGGLDLAVAGTAGEADLGNYRGSLAPFGIPSDDVVGLYQQDGGILDIRRANAAQIALARRGGVEFRPHTTVRGITQRAHGVTITTDDGTLDADQVILCVASWLPALLGDLGLGWRITLSQEQVSYFATPN